MAVCCLYSCLCQVRQSNSLNTSVASPDQYKSRKALPNMRKVCYQCCVLSHYASSRTVFLSHCASSRTLPHLFRACCHAVLAVTLCLLSYSFPVTLCLVSYSARAAHYAGSQVREDLNKKRREAVDVGVISKSQLSGKEREDAERVPLCH